MSLSAGPRLWPGSKKGGAKDSVDSVSTTRDCGKKAILLSARTGSAQPLINPPEVACLQQAKFACSEDNFACAKTVFFQSKHSNLSRPIYVNSLQPISTNHHEPRALVRRNNCRHALSYAPVRASLGPKHITAPQPSRGFSSLMTVKPSVVPC